MPNRKRMSTSRRVNLLLDARAGLIPASDDIAEERRLRANRIECIVRTVKAHLGSVARVSDGLAITNILADLRHYCDGRGLALKKLAKAAYALYLDDRIGVEPSDH